MKLVVLTGGIGSGKSAVCATLASMGVPVVDADVIAREVVRPGQDAYREIVAAFGNEVVREDGELDREKLGRIIFASSERRALLDQLTHPRIGARLAERVAEQAALDTPGVVLDIPLYLENRKRSGGDAMPADALIVVTVTPEIQLQRLILRDGLAREDALARIRAQMPLEEKVAQADYVIDNSGSPEETARQVRDIWKRIIGPGGASPA